MGVFENIKRNVTETFKNSFSVDTIQFNASNIDEIYREVFPCIEKSAMQFVYYDDYNVSDFQNTLWREGAQTISVTRIYCIPNLGKIQNLNHQLINDNASGVISYVLILSKLSAGQLAGEIREFCLFDEKYAIISQSEINKRNQFDFSVRADDIDRINTILNSLKSFLIISTEFLKKKFDLEEPLLMSADIINAVGQVLCSGDHVDKNSCSWYHSVWQYLRLMDMVSTPTWHKEFYASQLLDAINREKNKVLITGTADYSVLAYVINAFKEADVIGKISVLDLCATPLFACKWYANHEQYKIQTIQEDFLQYSPNETYDIICTDAFITRFSLEETFIVLRKWHDLLADGGQLITTMRLHDMVQMPTESELSRYIEDFKKRALHRSKMWTPFLRYNPHEIAEMAEVYAKRMQSNKISSEGELLGLIKQAGFFIRKSDKVALAGELYQTVYLEIHCEREI